MEEVGKLNSTTLQSDPLTHSRLKYLSALAQTSEDHVSRLGMGLSMASGRVDSDWLPTQLTSEGSMIEGINAKQLRGRTLFKDDLSVWMALTLRSQSPEDYLEWRQVMRAHWERGVEILMRKAIDERDWLRIIRACMPN